MWNDALEIKLDMINDANNCSMKLGTMFSYPSFTQVLITT